MLEQLKLDRPILIAFLLALAVAAVYGPVLGFDFTNYDDTCYVTGNPHVLKGLTWEGVCWAFTHGYSGNWHPLTWISHMLDRELFGWNAGGHHFTSLLLHAANSVLVFWVLRYLTGAAGRSALVAAFFALHPLHVESVAWVAERKDMLSSFFGLLCLWAYGAYAKERGRSLAAECSTQESTSNSSPPEPHPGTTPSTSGGVGVRPSPGAATLASSQPPGIRITLGRSALASPGGSRSPAAGPSCSQPTQTRQILTAATFHSRVCIYYLLALLFFVIGLMSKPMLVTWPCVLLLLDVWPLRRLRLGQKAVCEMPDPASGGAPHSTPCPPATSPLQLLVEKIPVFALAAASSVVTFLVQRAWGAVVPLQRAPVELRLLNVPVSYLRYLGKLFWPTDLAVLYPYERNWPVALVLVALLVLAGVTLMVLWQRGPRPYLLAGWAWFLGTLVPVIGLVQVGSQSIADRYTYLPSIGFFILVVWGAAELIGASRTRRLIGAGVATALLTACALVAQAQTFCWRNTETLFQHALAVTRGNIIAHNSLGFYYTALGNAEEAKRAFRAALADQPSCQYSWQGLAMALVEQQQYNEAIAACQEALKIDPLLAPAHSTIGLALTRLGQTNEALMQYSEALRIQPTLAEAHYNLANVLVNLGRINEAREHYEASLRTDPSSSDAHNNLAYMLVREGKLAEAESAYKSALALRPGLWQAHFGLASLLIREGKIEEAIKQYQATLAIRPDFVEALNRLAWLLAVHPDPNVRNGAQAVALAERACRITRYAQPTALRALAVAYAETGRFPEAVSAAQKAQELARAAGQTEFARRTQQMVEFLQTGHPYREALTAQPGKAP
ncbi:MAG: tetratricopeptide repeat protein [Verrucomicrobia bacterium]|nr:tetratricopeptide repeat protein [Verrucomicrobiota bacterium]